MHRHCCRRGFGNMSTQRSDQLKVSIGNMSGSSSEKFTKVLVSGDVNGRFEQLIKRVTNVNRKNGPFDVLICVGEFFGANEERNEDVVSGKVEFPINTYILGPCCPSTSAYYPEESVEFSSNLTYLGKKGVLNTTTGLRIAYLSGIEAAQSNAFQFTADTVNELLLPIKVESGFLGVDILLTSMWPAQVWKHSSNHPSQEVNGSRLISKLATALKPRYHFAGMGIHYERAPYRNHRVLLEAAQHVTRFIGLAAVDNAEKEKWLYAFSIKSMRQISNRSELTQQPPNTSEFPYMEIIADFILEERAETQKRENEARQGQFFFDMSSEGMEEDTVDRGGRKRRHPREEMPREARVQQPCWFCLSNVDVEKYLIVAVANHCYAAMPKGPLNNDHIMILSIGHIQSLVAAPQEVRDEIEQFKKAFTLMFNKQNKVIVAFERNYKTQHLQLQIVAIPKLCSKALKSSFLNAAQLKNIELTFMEPEQQIWDMVNEGCPYFYVELPDGSRLFSLSMRNFPLQFGREVLCGSALLNCEEKVDWRGCEMKRDEQAELVKRLQNSFKEFDFTDEGDSDGDGDSGGEEK
ncbi:unnamed protein product [Anisakis simplex]|uniref:CWF19-like protein 1 homolog (inferred by orthology to a C. elegans protein) n=1 Tax=Anisakis simplex TaxID=6269 RepID=A0A0M3JUS1_ANISI|nr:unnamed protein product [Anisakis simplex]